MSKVMMNTHLHWLSRATFGPTTEDLGLIQALGTEEWLNRQLNPQNIDNTILEQRLQAYPTLTMSPTDLMVYYPRPAPGERPVQGQEPWRPLQEVSEAFMLAVRYSEHQLLEVMTNFWFNHFNVYGPENINFHATPPYILRTIRANALGNFPRLVEETARSPAMLYYLDNYLSTRTLTRANGQTSGLNENYARELLELHTLGVEAGYSQDDIIQAAKVLTGWSITRRRENRLEFQFYPRLHEEGTKTVFGRNFGGGGISEGMEMLRYLSLRPETADHIARKLTAHFVDDEPPQSLVGRVRTRFLDTRGDIPSMLREIFLSNEFSEDRHFRSKTKSPLRLFASSLRTTGAEVLEAAPLVRIFNGLGQPLFRCQPPTGYPDNSEAVISAGVFLSEGNMSRALAFDRLRGAGLDTAALNPEDLTGSQLADSLLESLLHTWKPRTEAVLKRASRRRGVTVNDFIALILTSPDFMSY